MLHVHLTPVGLPHTLPPTIHQQTSIEERLHSAIITIAENPFKQIYNASHPDTKELLKSFDALFCHGYQELENL